jgi:hypothetical protein
MRSRRFLIAAVAAFGLAVASPVSPAPASSDGPIAHAAKSCSSGYVHATISGAGKCLRRGQYCARGSDAQYHRYGFHCHKRDANGSYHLS